ncbi:hypothetical protein BJ964_003615 [Actinoplanes lobatus]|uniref:Uncharacterized protein n=1 Tax=Actinoplanes lobatus TaxID=113568 RepID=A0A7W7HFA3_9ACTN|nr:hypothetical protein [Actinoplanes lobatus]
MRLYGDNLWGRVASAGAHGRWAPATLRCPLTVGDLRLTGVDTYLEEARDNADLG